jgi:hypothetical protein
VDVKAVVAAALAGKPQPTGTITLMEGSTALGSGTLDNGSATIKLSSLTTGSHAITGVYSGDSDFNANSTATITIPVAPPPPSPAVSITAAPSSLSLTRGQAGTVIFTAVANSTFSGSVALEVSGSSSGMTAFFSPGSITLAAGQTATANLIVSTTSPSAAARFPGRAGGAAALATLFLLAVPRRLRKKLSIRALVLAGILSLAGIFGLQGCGGSSVKVAHTGTATLKVTATPTGLPAQQITVTVDVR